ncbi:MAG: zinc ribbon domain-containing protein [Bacteroidales bacterium]|nr:zinc ribbon domain-containing protein [Bacteroidales bacterium]MBQ9310734.1 zinc ribbon domain-containing protein [Bacteroidales bacterium]
MRCLNCGWENPDNLQKCEKCNSPLDAHIAHEAPAHPAPEHEEVLRGTISEQQVFADPAPTNREDKNCPTCGYPLRDGMHHCPNCGEDLNPEKSSAQSAKEVHKVAPKHNATVNPWANPNAGKTFKLEPVAWDGEKGTPAAQSFIGESVELNRNNTDPTNNTITSRVQAEISCDNRVWSIEDKSSQGTTFIQAKRKIALEDGDVIMLGNRKFIFKAE